MGSFVEVREQGSLDGTLVSGAKKLNCPASTTNLKELPGTYIVDRVMCSVWFGSNISNVPFLALPVKT